jgi:hypothetical protein
MLFEEDFGVFFNSEEFAVEAVIRGRKVVGLEGRSCVLSNDVETQKASFTCPSRCIWNVAHGERIHMNEHTYAVVGIQPDGMGLTALILEWIE